MNLLTKFLNLFKDDPRPNPAVKSAPIPKPSPYADWSVEHYPETNRYYPVWKRSKYVRKDYDTGIYELKDPFLFMYANYGKTEQEAWKIVDLVNEQQFKQNVIVLRK